MLSTLFRIDEVWPSEDVALERFQNWHVNSRIPSGTALSSTACFRLLRLAFETEGTRAMEAVARREVLLFNKVISEAQDEDVLCAGETILGGTRVTKTKVEVDWQSCSWLHAIGEHKVAAGVDDLRRALSDIVDDIVDSATKVVKCGASTAPPKSKPRNNDDMVPDDAGVAPLVVHRERVDSLISLIEKAATLNSRQQLDEDLAKISERADDWKARLQREARELSKLLPLFKGQAELNLQGETYTPNGFGRTMTYYPQLGEKQYIQHLSAHTRKYITDFQYAEVDISSAHIFVAWAAVKAHFKDEASQICSALYECAVDKKAARERVARENNVDVATAKTLILASLNQQNSGYRSGLIKRLIDQRPHIEKALANHPVIKPVLHLIDENCKDAEKVEVRRVSLMLQTLESVVLKRVSRELERFGHPTALWEADGLFVTGAEGLEGDLETSRRLACDATGIHVELDFK